MFSISASSPASWKLVPAAALPTGGPAPKVDHSRGYPVGDGSFARDARGTRPQPERDLQLAMMANDCYSSNATGATGTRSERDLAAAGWSRLKPEGDHLVDAQGRTIPIEPSRLSNPDSGFDAAIYQNAQGQYVVAMRGTDSWAPDKGDLGTNAGQGMGLKSEQYEEAMRLAEDAIGAFGDGNVVITGQSLGGGLASAAMLKTGAPGVTFDSAGLSDTTLRRLGFEPNAVRADAATSGQIRRYHVEGEVLTGVQQSPVLGLPDAVGHELVVAPPAGASRNPVKLHGGKGDGAPFVESLRQNAAREPAPRSATQALVEHLGEFRFNQFAGNARTALATASQTAGVARHAAGEIKAAVRGDLAHGRPAAAAGRIAGAVVNGGADGAAVLLRHQGDRLGDAIAERTTLAGSGLRDLGRATHLQGPANRAARVVEGAGERVNHALDTVSAKAGDALDRVGDRAQSGLRGAGQWLQRHVPAF